MSAFKGTAQVLGKTGAIEVIDVDLAMYEVAASQKTSLSQHLERTYGHRTDLSKGSVMEQAMASSGIRTKFDPRTGLGASTLKEVIDGSAAMQMADNDITRSSGQGNNTPASRILFPEVVLQLVPAVLQEDNSDFMGAYSRMVATTVTVNTPRVEQPKIDTRAPEGNRSQAISQLTEPAKMVSITLQDSSYRIPTHAIGLEISDEALSAATIDLVAISLAAQARGEQIGMVEDSLRSMIQGDVDVGMSALVGEDLSNYDAASTASAPTHMAYIQWLRSKYRVRSIDWIITDIVTAAKLENRVGRPTGQMWPNGTQQFNNDRGTMEAQFSIENLSVRPPKVLLVDKDVLGVDTFVGIDSRFAIRRLVNVSATYAAIQDFVLKKGKGYRFDFGEASHRLVDDGWALCTL